MTGLEPIIGILTHIDVDGKVSTRAIVIGVHRLLLRDTSGTKHLGWMFKLRKYIQRCLPDVEM